MSRIENWPDPEARSALVLIAISPNIITPACHLELAGDAGQVDEDRRIGIAQPHDIDQELLVVGVANDLVVSQARISNRLGAQTAAHAGREAANANTTAIRRNDRCKSGFARPRSFMKLSRIGHVAGIPVITSAESPLFPPGVIVRKFRKLDSSYRFRSVNSPPATNRSRPRHDGVDRPGPGTYRGLLRPIRQVITEALHELDDRWIRVDQFQLLVRQGLFP